MPMEMDSRARLETRSASTSALVGDVLALTTAIHRGDTDAFAVFYEVWFDRVYALARTLTRRDESFCLDVVQDTMLRVVRALRPMPDGTALERWLKKVVHSTALDVLRRDLRRTRREQRTAAGASDTAPATAPSTLDLEERMSWLAGELATLSRDDRALLEQRFVRGHTLRTAGAAVGLSGHAAHGRVRRLIEQLRSSARRIFHE
jgi:RNA polymerase sigma factor (sigma-70 family)